MSDPYTPPAEVDDDDAAPDPPQDKRPHITVIAWGLFAGFGVVSLFLGNIADGLGALMLAFSIWAIGAMVRGRG